MDLFLGMEMELDTEEGVRLGVVIHTGTVKGAGPDSIVDSYQAMACVGASAMQETKMAHG